MSLHLEGLYAGYGKVAVLHDVSIDVRPGEVVALIGPNGAGKSTVLRAATGMVSLSAGTVRLGDRILSGHAIEAIARAGIAHVPEGRRLFSGLTVRDNLRLGGFRVRVEARGSSARERRDEAFEAVVRLFPRLGERLDQVAGSMSGGEQQMCAIARALMMRPAFLLIDELSLGLAPIVVDEILARLPEIVADGTGVLLVEQDAGAALEVAQRAYVLENGRIVLAGSAAALSGDARVREAYLGA